MDYDEFCKEYKKLFKSLMQYKPDEVGALVFSEKLADLSDKYPEFEEALLGE